MPAPSASTPFLPNLNQHLALEPLEGPSLAGLTHPSLFCIPRNWVLNFDKEEGEGEGLKVKGKCVVHGIDAIAEFQRNRKLNSHSSALSHSQFYPLMLAEEEMIRCVPLLTCCHADMILVVQFVDNLINFLAVKILLLFLMLISDTLISLIDFFR